MVLNPDITAMPGSIETMIGFLKKNEKVGMVGPKLINPDGTVQYSSYKFPPWYMPIYRRTILGKMPWAKKDVAKYLMTEWDHNSNKAVEWLLGACMMIKKDALDRVGLMDERFFLYFSDIDWCRRFWQTNYAVYYISNAEMVHYHQRDSAEVPGIRSVFNKTTRIHISDAIKYFAKYFGAKKPNIN